MSRIRQMHITGYYLIGDYPKLYGRTDEGTHITLIVEKDDIKQIPERFPVGEEFTFIVDSPEEWTVQEKE